MGTKLISKVNQCYEISASRFFGGKDNGMMLLIEISNPERVMGIGLTKKQAIDFCSIIITGLNEVGEA